MRAEEWPAARAIEPTAASSLWKGTPLRDGREGLGVNANKPSLMEGLGQKENSGVSREDEANKAG